MNLPIFYTDTKDLTMMQNKWASLLNPILASPMNNTGILKNISLTTGANVINHMQGKILNGYIVIGMHGAYAQIYDTPSDMPKLTLNLVSSADTVIDLAVF